MSTHCFIVYSCVSIFQLISSLPTYPPTTVNLTYTYPYLFHSRCYSLYLSYFSCWVWHMPLDTSASEVDTVFSCVSIFQLISSLPTYPPREHNLTYTYLHLFHSRCCSSRRWHFFPFRSTLKSLGVILGGGLNIKVL